MAAPTEVMERLYRLVVDGTQATNQLKKIAKDTASIDERFAKMAQSFRTAIGVIAAGGLAKGIADNAQQLNSLAASMKVLRGSAEEGGDAMRRIFNIVQDTGASLEAVGDGFKRMTIGLQSLGANNEQIEQITSNFIKLGQVGGSSMEEINGALMQFGQALSSGVLQGDEFKSISEQFPLLMQKLAKSLNVTTGELKKMGSEGKLTSDIIANTLLKSTAEINAQFDQLPVTFDRSLNKIKASLAELEQTFFNQSQAGDTIAITLDEINKEIRKVIENSQEWAPIINDVSNSFKQLAEFALGTVAEVKKLGAAFVFLKDVAANVFDADARQFALDRLKASMDDIDSALAGSLERLRHVKTESEKAFGSFAALAVGAAVPGLLEATSVLGDADKAAKDAAKAFKELETAWSGFWAKVQTPDEEFDQQVVKLKQIQDAGIATADQIAKVTAELDKVRDKANEELRQEGLSEFQKGFEDAAASIKKAGDEAEQTRGRLEVLSQLRGVPELSAAYLELAESMGETATAADQVAVAVAKVNEEGKRTAELKAEFEKLKESGQLTEEQLKKVKDALGGLGENKDKIDSMAVAIGQTLAGSVDGFVDALLDSEGDINAWFANLLKQIGKLIVQMVILQQLKAQLGGTGLGALLGFAQGGAFAGGTGLPQGIYNQPTLFKFAKGGTFGAGRGKTGVMGEAGPEAIVPLKRTNTGDLGVQASPVVVNVNNYTEGEVEVQESTKPDGTKEIEITIKKVVQAAFNDGSMDSTMRNNYNLSRQGR